jgi:hypothetical protein
MEDKILYQNELNSYTTYFHLPFNEIVFGKNSKSTKKKRGIFQHANSSNTEKDFIENYGNKLCSVFKEHYKLEIKRSGDKLSVRYFYKFFTRVVGVHYFKKKYDFRFFTINLKTYDFYIGSILNHQNKKKVQKYIIKNPFNFPDKINNFFTSINQKFFEDGFVNKFENIIKSEMDFQCGFNTTDDLMLEITKRNLLRRGVKIPNNLKVFIKNIDTFPSAKHLKSSQNKFVDAYMLKNQLTGKTLKKYLHEVNYINIPGYKSAIDLFGYNLLYRKKMLKKFLESDKSRSYYGMFPSNLTNKELETMLRYFEFLLDGKINSLSISDHIKYFIFLRTLRNDVKLQAQTIEDFVEEHEEFSDIYASYKTSIITRLYSEKFEDELSEPIYSNDGSVYYPVLLKTTNDYICETTVQSNCVRNYVDNPDSVIVSLRSGTNISPERLTIEYKLYYDEMSKQIGVENTQCLGKFNSTPRESWSVPVEIMNTLMKSLIKRTNFTLKMIKSNRMKGDEVFNLIIPNSSPYMSTRFGNKLIRDLKWDGETEEIEIDFDFGLFF